ncbi:MAG: two-component system response regulator [Deltaproteobacteria bacterium RIFCSPLOWO2_12_FULL_43_16]|nr:MAG: two-component system response regulator [Deltaproteobacteria bacterium GWA2_43_19]OGQ12434.1 MAG: two-component system response regulator [Deltaproteobacteria bacterium RIFCSPHIGHO2_02_FULL_43_33]OGQ44532.1 MAG: two-component system response regulator [Deltaproteobacteria bacterium RIFCSPLOWO2_01_FULL_42_9]OGQ59407.1 MAG: two-component system response regulator [Deltaproteobacteria bacterium RIFCSPLOWO2_12_FULL_43_16]HBR17828.1 response regulator [Deltaproteobacteria bacterium]
MSYRILIIDDSPTMRQLLVFALKRLSGVEIDEAADGVDGYKKLTSGKFDLVLADINMPVMDGLKLVSIIRGNPAYKDLPIVMVTTEGGKEDREKAISLGANAYITKPIQAPHVLTVVKELLKIP